MFLHIIIENKKIVLSIKNEQFIETDTIEYGLKYSHADQLVYKISEFVPDTKSIQGIIVTKKEDIISFTLQRIVFTVINILSYSLEIPVAFMDDKTSFNSLKWFRRAINPEYRDINI